MPGLQTRCMGHSAGTAGDQRNAQKTFVVHGSLEDEPRRAEAPLDERNQTENQEPASTDEADVLPQPPSAVRGGPAPGTAPRPLTQFLTCRILRLHHALDAQAVAILSDISGIGPGQWRVLAMVGAGGVMTARGPARATGPDPAFISRTVRSLEDASLLWTARPDADRRVVTIGLTAHGTEFYARTLPFKQARQEALLEALSPDERDAIFRIIDALESAARRRKFTA